MPEKVVQKVAPIHTLIPSSTDQALSPIGSPITPSEYLKTFPHQQYKSQTISPPRNSTSPSRSKAQNTKFSSKSIQATEYHPPKLPAPTLNTRNTQNPSLEASISRIKPYIRSKTLQNSRKHSAEPCQNLKNSPEITISHNKENLPNLWNLRTLDNFNNHENFQNFHNHQNFEQPKNSFKSKFLTIIILKIFLLQNFNFFFQSWLKEFQVWNVTRIFQKSLLLRKKSLKWFRIWRWNTRKQLGR